MFLPQLPNRTPLNSNKFCNLYLVNNWDEDTEPLAHGGGGACDALAAVLEASGRWRTKGFEESFEAVEENNCLRLS